MSEEAFIKIKEKQVLGELKFLESCFGGYGFLYCFTDEKIKEFEKILGIKRESLFDLYFFVEIAKNQNTWISTYAYRKDLKQREEHYDEDFQGRTFEEILYRRCHLIHLKERLEDLQEGDEYTQVLNEILFYNKIPEINPQSYDIKNIFFYNIRPLIEGFRDLTDPSLDNLIYYNKKGMLSALQKRLDPENGVDEYNHSKDLTRRFINEINRIKKLEYYDFSKNL